MSNPEDVDRAINDPAEWGTPQRGRKSEKRRRGAVVSVRMTEAELVTVQARAAQLGQTVGTFMRESALKCDAPVQVPSGHAMEWVSHMWNASPSNEVFSNLKEAPASVFWVGLTR